MTTPWLGARRPMTAGAMQMAADEIGCELAALRAVWEVEAAKRFWADDGSVLRRFEPHKLPRHLWAEIDFAVPAGLAPWKASLRIGTGDRERMFRAAWEIDGDAALAATSWGAPQIMGFNHRDAGFASARAMVEAMAGSEDAHLRAFVVLITAWRLCDALIANDWLSFARGYNGTGQPEVYARRLEAAYRRASGGASAEVLRIGDRGAEVRRLQVALGVEPDGAFGRETDAAVRAFQGRHGIHVDGVVGRETWAVLKDAAGARPLPQPTPLDALADQAGPIGGTVAVVAGAVKTAEQTLPPDVYTAALWLALGLAFTAAAFWIIRNLWRRA